MSSSYTVVVSSSDNFEDCWHPFFTLFKRYWPDCPAPILLNTETKPYAFPGLDVRASQAEVGVAEKPSWTERLAKTLDLVTTPLVLYMQEDYFLEAPVNAAFIDEMAHHMLANPDIGHLNLTHFSTPGPLVVTADERLMTIAPQARYRISCQAGLWRKECLRSYLGPAENIWMFEIFGTWRSWRRRERFLTVNRERYHPDLGTAVMQYTHTGIIKGKWHPAMPRLFERHGLDVDFSRRGFYEAPPRWLSRLKTFRKVAQDPVKMVKVRFGWEAL